MTQSKNVYEYRIGKESGYYWYKCHDEHITEL